MLFWSSLKPYETTNSILPFLEVKKHQDLEHKWLPKCWQWEQSSVTDALLYSADLLKDLAILHWYLYHWLWFLYTVLKITQ